MHRNQSVSAHSFAMVPRADIPRSRFNVQTSHKTTFDAGELVPVAIEIPFHFPRCSLKRGELIG